MWFCFSGELRNIISKVVVFMAVALTFPSSCGCGERLSAAAKRWKYMRRLKRYDQMDFQFAAWQVRLAVLALSFRISPYGGIHINFTAREVEVSELRSVTEKKCL